MSIKIPALQRHSLYFDTQKNILININLSYIICFKFVYLSECLRIEDKYLDIIFFLYEEFGINF